MAAKLAAGKLGPEMVRLGALRDRLEEGVLEAIPGAVINGAPLTTSQCEEGMGEAAFSIAEEFRDWQQSLRSAAVLLDQIAELEPE